MSEGVPSELFHHEVGGKRLRFWSLGPRDAARQVVFLHHGLGGLESWKGLPHALQREADARCLVYERWGYGESAPRERFEPGFMEAEVPTLLDIVDEFAGGRADLVGHSDGGSIALLAAARDAERVASVVSVAAHTFVEPLTRTSIEGLLDELDREGPHGWLRRFHGTRAEALLRAWGDVWLSDEHRGWDIRSLMPSVNVPLLAVQGEGDEFGTMQQLDSITTQVGGSEEWKIPQVGHTPFVDEAEFARRIAKFWGAGS